MHRSLQPPDSRTYSVEVTSRTSNLLHHRRLRLFKRLLIIQHLTVCVNSFFKYFFTFFVVFQGFLVLFLFIETERQHFAPQGTISCEERFAYCTIRQKSALPKEGAFHESKFHLVYTINSISRTCRTARGSERWLRRPRSYPRGPPAGHSPRSCPTSGRCWSVWPQRARPSRPPYRRPRTCR